MEITYDEEADEIYIEFRSGDFAKNKKIDDFTVIDLDSEENILDASKRIPVESFSEVSVKNLIRVEKG